ncbi:GNAT family N-acetyltransferase [Lentilactobacillus curieae]|uniref:GNAT family N-acetyltransferase n=1 Tax=Lentilactobacillus curieae TaxID=1138822 RepID=UPI000A3E940B|nr:GNAT family N-acetyltransferase [Lentilactobacillus curieae]
MATINSKFSKLNDLSPKEIFDIFQLRVAVFVVEQHCPYQEVDEDDLTAFHLTIRNDAGELIAYSRVIPEQEGKVAHIGRVIVRSDQRKSGMGKKLLQASLDFSKQEMPNLEKYFLAGQEYVKNFYHSFGFQDVSDVYLEDDIPHIDMELPVSK